MTMPGRFFIQKFLANLIKNKCDFAVLEVTSEGIKQKRHLFIEFDIVVCTNIKPEHIESHGGFAHYKQAKSRLFNNLKRGSHKKLEKIIIVNNDDTETRSFLVYDADKKITYGFGDQNSIRGKIVKSSLSENVMRISGKDDIIIKLNNGGPFVLENALAAMAVAYSLDIDIAIVKQALEAGSLIPGRFEIVSKNPYIIVDYAHTVAAVEKILSFVRHQWTGTIIHMFGAAGGGRDKWKRPKLAELSEKYTDFSILTEENSFDEPIENILEDILNGFRNKERVKIIPKRKEAAAEAIKRSDDATLLLCTGKGSETVIAGPLGRKIPYNEKETIWQLLKSSQK
jgi:UDP-N-acetylmuramoyl-L-alanyl-D-glutamate--2,6-diaminopimelate ligase